MTQRQFNLRAQRTLDDHVRETRRLLERLEAAKRGDLKARRVRVKSYSVEGYSVRAHTRILWR